MKLGAYTFVSGKDVTKNLSRMLLGMQLAAKENVELLAFPECALTGYPPFEVESAAQIDFDAVRRALSALRMAAADLKLQVLAGTAAQGEAGIVNRVYCLYPDGAIPAYYDKRALWGYDRENFVPGREEGIFDAQETTFGVRICYEVRFPEYFRQLYIAGVRLSVVCFRDTSKVDDPDRYQLIRAHLQTRACENGMAIFSVNTPAPYQTAPTALFDENGMVTAEAPRGKEGLFVAPFTPKEETFGLKGRRVGSDTLLGLRRQGE